MHVRLLFPANYLSSDDLEAAGRDVTLTIARLEQEEVRTEQGNEPKWVLFFEEIETKFKKDRKRNSNKRLVLNKTNANQIAKLYGPETDEWVGKKVTLYMTQCMAFGAQVDCIRIRDRVPSGNGKKPAPKPEPELDDVPPEQLGGLE